MMNRSYVITTSVSGTSKTQIWDSSRPLPIGHPFRWVIERTSDGLRVRNLAGAGTEGVAKKGGFKEISDSALEKGTEFDLPDGDVQLRIRPVHRIAPAYEARQGKTLTIYACAGSWVIESQVLSASSPLFTGKISRKPVFTLQRSHDRFTFSAKEMDVVVHSGKESRTVSKGASLQFDFAEMAESILEIGTHSWRFGLATQPAIPAPSRRGVNPDTKAFQGTLQLAALVFAAILAMSWFWPAPKPAEELIPPQVAKLIMSAPQKAAAPEPKSSLKEIAAAAPQKVQQTAVVQAFRAKALNNAISGLLKGGMTKLLAQSDFVHGAQNNEAKRMFDTKSKALKSSAPDSGVMNAKNVAVAAVGGAATDGGAGYGKGEHASVKGQGGAFVSMDTGGASVDEGLTKDEVGEIIHRHLSEVRYCYESAMVRTPDMEGKLITNFVIGGNGTVKTTEVKQSTLPDPRLDDCILRRLATWKFPNPRGGVDVAVTYPFIFKTLGR